jgi:hypothetical protein
MLICIIGMPMACHSICKTGELLFEFLVNKPLYAYSVKPHSKRRRFALVLVYCVLYWIVGTGFYSYSMNWHWLDCAYYMFIATSTVGYGDYIPAGKLAGADLLFMVLGLNLMTLFFQVQQEVGEAHLTKIKDHSEAHLTKIKDHSAAQLNKIKDHSAAQLNKINRRLTIGADSSQESDAEDYVPDSQTKD